MERVIAVVAVLLLFILFPFTARGAEPPGDVVSTHCGEVEVPLDADHSVARLTGCGDQYDDNLLWHLDRIDQLGGELDGQYDRNNRGSGSVIYVMDTGVRADHTEFLGANGNSRVVAGFDAAGSVPTGASTCWSFNKALAPCYGDFNELSAASHGTGVASIAAGRQVGVAPDALVVSIRVMNERGLATTRTYMDGLNDIIVNAWDPKMPSSRTAVVNISGWVLERLAGTPENMPYVPFSAVEKKMRDMVGGVDANGDPDPDGKRFLFVVAANNLDGGCGRAGSVDRFPAILGRDVEGIITVGGMTARNLPWNGTCRGGVEVLAPAQSIFSATITATDQYRGKKPNLRSGTSFAAPIISGIAARLLAARPDLTPQQLESWITSTPSRTANTDSRFADGRVGYTRAVAPQRSLMEQARLAP